MSEIQQTPENTILWIIVIIIVSLIGIVLRLFQTTKLKEPSVSNYFINHNDGNGYQLNEDLYNRALHRYKKCNNKPRWFIILYDYVNK